MGRYGDGYRWRCVEMEAGDIDDDGSGDDVREKRRKKKKKRTEDPH